ncbi:hypothetical protein GIB67_039738 [Kingdonia uniflora]|uniref:Uncharacterized protein n=1 Tax=Kingdonia uniflora TaxID=39325 RepID=A0A7J7MQ75_9MAGN|nr:hypothetical protein GIB67_039738 [Kingdonia uniflora]
MGKGGGNEEDNPRGYFAGRTWNDNVIWVKGNCPQRDDEEPLDLRFRTVKQKSGEVTKEKRRRVEFSGEKVAEVRPGAVDDVREVEKRARLAALHGEEDTSKMVTRLMKGIWLGIEEEKSKLKKAKSKLEKELARAKTKTMKEARQLKASHVMAIGQLQVEAKANLDKMVEERDRLGRHFMLKGYSEEEADAIKANTYVEEGDDEEEEVVEVMDDLDRVSHQIVLDNQGNDVKLPEGGSEKAVREMSLRINDLESGLSRESETSKALPSAQAELQDSSHTHEDNVLMCNREFVEQFDKMKEVNKNREDQYVKVHFKLMKLNQAISDLTLQVKEKDYEIKKGLKELSEATTRAEKLQRSANLREFQHKLDVALIREKVLEGEIKTKELLVKRKEELLKDLPAREELNAKIGGLRARVVDLEAMNLAESAKHITKLEEDVIYHDKVDA